MEVLVNDQIVLHGTVGEDMFYEGFTARDVINALAKKPGKAVTVRLNSGGGYADEGVAIYNALKTHNADVTVIIDGIAASAASIIAMAGKKIIMRAGTTMMIHDPYGLTQGNADDHEKSIQSLNAIAEGMANIYAKKTGQPATKMRADMKAETWFTAAAAVANGFADRTDDEPAVQASAFDYRIYANAPEEMRALASSNGWKLARHKPATELPRAEGRSTQVGKGDTMTDNKSASAAEQAEITKADLDKAVADAQASGAKAAQDRIAAIMALDAAKDRPKLANHIGFKTAMSVDDAKAMLEASGVETGSKVLSIEERSKANADAGHQPQSSAQPKLRVDIVADMKRRAGITV